MLHASCAPPTVYTTGGQISVWWASQGLIRVRVSSPRWRRPLQEFPYTSARMPTKA